MRSRVKFLSIVISFLMILSPAYAQLEGAKTVTAGDICPYSGTLLTSTAAAKLIITLETNKELCNARAEKELDLLQERLTLKIEILSVRLNSSKEQYDSIVKLKDEQIQGLHSHIKDIEGHGLGKTFWFSMGVVGGVIIVLASAYAVGEVSNR